MEPLLFQADQVIYCDDASKWFNHYMPLIPNNAIIHKTITGFGATTTEIKAKRNSVLVLPNVATIQNKYEGHENDNGPYTVFAVYEGVTDKQIAEYLKSNKGFKKILSTPESLNKVRKAFEQAKVNGTSDFFILIDEEHKYIQDNGYRPQIVKAMDYFFKFVNKAMISSTPIKPSDPRFAEFKSIKLQPTYDYAKPVELLYHNNLLFALNNVFKKNPDIKQCVFLNSLDGIANIIKMLGISDSATIFCSKAGAKYLKKLSQSEGCFFNAYDRFDAAVMKQYNFFTSSLFNGLDIILDEPPMISMISIPNDSKTYLDPFTDVLQILGRFRKTLTNPTGYHGKAVHLLEATYNDNYKSTEGVNQWFNANQHVYETILTLMYSNTNQTERIVYREALKRIPFHTYMANDYHLNRNNPAKPDHPEEENPDRFSYDYFKIDNLYEEERINSYYCNPAYLWLAYREGGQVEVNNIKLTSFEFSTNYCYAMVKGQSKLNLKGGKRYAKETIRQLVLQLSDCDWLAGESGYYDRMTYEITKHHPLVRLAFDKLGRDKIAELDYKIVKIRQALIDYDVKAGKNHNQVIDSIYCKLFLGVKIPLTKIKREIHKVYNHYQLTCIAKATDIKLWYEVKEAKIVTYKKEKTTKGDGKSIRVEQRAFILLERKFNIHRELLIT